MDHPKGCATGEAGRRGSAPAVVVDRHVDENIPGAGMHAAARRALRCAVRAGAADYRRATQLPRLIPVAPADLADDSDAGTRCILAMLARALRSERRRGRAGHWSYDLNRHIGLHQAIRAETARLKRRSA